MSFQVLTDEQLELLTEEERKSYEEGRALHEERLKYVQQIEKYDGIELPEVKPELTPVFMAKASEVPAISIEKKDIAIPDTKLAAYSKEMPKISADAILITDVPEIVMVDTDATRKLPGKVSELSKGAVQISDIPNIDAKLMPVDKPEFSITHSEVPEVVIPKTAEYSYDLSESGKVILPEISFGDVADVPQIDMSISFENEVPAIEMKAPNTRKIDITQIENMAVENIELNICSTVASEFPHMSVDGKNISVPQNDISTVSIELPKLSVDSKDIKVPENVINTMSKELPKMLDEFVQISELPTVEVKSVNPIKPVFDIKESNIPEIQIPTVQSFSYVQPEPEEVSLVEVTVVSPSIPKIDMRVQSQTELPNVNIPSMKLPEIDILKIGNNGKAEEDDVNSVMKAFSVPEITPGFTREINITVNGNIAMPELSQLPTAVSDERIAEIKSLINA